MNIISSTAPSSSRVLLRGELASARFVIVVLVSNDRLSSDVFRFSGVVKSDQEVLKWPWGSAAWAISE